MCILILFIVCIILIGLVLALATSLWGQREKLKADKLNNKHPLTGLSNRSLLLEDLEIMLESSKHDQINVALLFLDIDDFNNVNSSLGIKLGDLLLQNVGQCVVAEVGAFSKYVYHVGSDEFVAILYDYGKDTGPVADIANDLINAIAQPISIQGYDLQISCCVGICTYPECANDAEELLKRAGSARDNAKKIGYGSYSFYTQ